MGARKPKVNVRKKTCSKCGKKKWVKEFHNCVSTRDGYKWSCKVCSSREYIKARDDIRNGKRPRPPSGWVDPKGTRTLVTMQSVDEWDKTGVRRVGKKVKTVARRKKKGNPKQIAAMAKARAARSAQAKARKEARDRITKPNPQAPKLKTPGLIMIDDMAEHTALNILSDVIYKLNALKPVIGSLVYREDEYKEMLGKLHAAISGEDE